MTKTAEFAHAMLREIHEQPLALARTLDLYLDGDGLRKEFASLLATWSPRNDEVLIAASGSSRHSGLAGEVLLEDLAGLTVDVEYASEYSCRGGIDRRHPALIVLSQSGETSDTLAALREGVARGERTLAITNASGSTMAIEAAVSMPLAAGVELAIPATKSFTCQLAALVLLALHEGRRLDRVNEEEAQARVAGLRRIAAPDGPLATSLPRWQEQMSALAHLYRDARSFLFLGRGIHYAIAREGALKLKEASYVHAEGYPTGELKHGPNALVSETVPLVIIATCDACNEGSQLRYEKTIALLRELKTQGARVIAIANRGDHAIAEIVSNMVEVDAVDECLLPILEVVPLQLFAYSMALERGVEVDRPRHLSKSVVEA